MYTVKTYKEFLRAVHYLKPKFRRAQQINCICECIYVLKGKILLKEEQNSKLGKYIKIGKILQYKKEVHFYQL